MRAGKNPGNGRGGSSHGGTPVAGDESQGPEYEFDTDGTVLEGARHVLFVHAHPDDETLATGALMAELVDRGIVVTLVTCTRGERGEVVPGSLSHLEGTPDLATHRESELAGALAELGVTRHVWLGTPPARAAHLAAQQYEDSGMRWVREGLAGPAADASPRALSALPLAGEVDDLVAIVDALQNGPESWSDPGAAAGAAPENHPPTGSSAVVDVSGPASMPVAGNTAPDLIVSYNEIGGYGHPDHVRAREIAEEAARARGIRCAEIISDASTLHNAQDAVGQPRVHAEAQRDAPAETWFRLEHRLSQVKRALAHHASQVTVVGDDVVHSGGQRTPIETSVGLRVLS